MAIQFHNDDELIEWGSDNDISIISKVSDISKFTREGLAQEGLNLYVSNGVSKSKVVTGYTIGTYFGTTITDATLGAGGGAGTGIQMGVITIPGGVMTANSTLVLEALFTSTSTGGTQLKDTQVRIGPVSGTFATATLFSGQSSLTTQKYCIIDARISNLGVLTSQRATPYNQSNYSTSANTPISTNIDTSLDWNIYFAGMVAAVAGTNLTLENATVRIIN